MKTIGLIAEYNPFHNGHLYHIQEIKRLYPDSVLILALSGSFVQRGDFSLLTKWEKTELALRYGVDLVFELPFAFATQSADIFADGAIQILEALHVDTLVFGSECHDVSLLKKLAETQLTHPDYESTVKDYLAQGNNYPTALSKALATLIGTTIDQPNDLLGISYCKALFKRNSTMEVVTIQRTNSFHDTAIQGDIASATSIRAGLRQNKSIQAVVPKETMTYLKKARVGFDEVFPFLKHQILANFDHLDRYQTVDEGIEHRIQRVIYDVTSLEELIQAVKTKRYTYNKVRRMFLHILCGFTKEEAKQLKDITYLRLLGFTIQGQRYLNKVKKDLPVPLLSKFDPLLHLEQRVTAIYGVLNNDTFLMKQEYQQEPIHKK